MLYLRHAACFVAALALATPAFAQEPQSPEAARADAATAPAEQAPGDGLNGQLPRPGQPLPTDVVLPASLVTPETRNLMKLIGQDFKNFFSKDTGQVLAITAIGAIAAAPWDREGVNNGFNIPTTLFEAGNIMGGVLFQASAGAGAYAFGRAVFRNDKFAMLGRDVVRAQVLSQAMVQTLKFTVRRERPDGSNKQSFPSGHSASAFATAAVLQRHYGWKLGVPAFAAGSYVALARMAWNRHHATDVVMGAGFGIAAARTVTMSVGKSKFNLGVQPQAGGASVNFTKIYK
jgi:membrane-associated phospholipid phosphatase